MATGKALTGNNILLTAVAAAALSVVVLAACPALGGIFGERQHVEGVDGAGMGVCMEGDTLYCIAGSVLYSLDISQPLAPKVIGRLDGMDNARQVVVQKGFVYVVSRETGLRIVDARNPRNMRLRSRYDSVEFATGIDVVGGTAFLSERIYGVEVVDVSNPDRPAHVCIRKTGESQSNRYRNGYLYSGEWGGGMVTVFDAHDLKNFRAIGHLRLDGFGDGVEIDGQYLYCSTGHDAKNVRKKVADPIGAGRGLDIFSLADPANPKWVSRVDFPVFKPRNEDFWTPRVANGLAFCCDSHNGLFVVDVHDPASPKVVDRFCVELPRSNWPSAAISSVAVGKGCIYVTSAPGGLWVLPVAGVEPPARPKGKPPASPGYREEYPTDTAQFHVYRPSAAGQARTACLRGDVVYAAFGDAGLHVLEILPKGGFKKLGELPGGRRVTDCCFVGDRLVVVEGVDGFAVYEMEGKSRFKEVARQPTSLDKSVAFWCWPVDDRHVVLTPRCGPYNVFDVDDIFRKNPLARFFGTCQWNKYLPDRAVGGALPTLVPYKGIRWLDVSSPVPKDGGLEPCDTRTIDQGNGICVFGNDRYLYTVGAGYVFMTPDRKRSEWHPFPPVEAFGKGARFGGIPRSDGRLVVCTGRSARKYVVWDFADPDAPKLLRAYQLSGNPDIAVLHRGRAIIPAGHQGLIMEKCAAFAADVAPADQPKATPAEQLKAKLLKVGDSPNYYWAWTHSWRDPWKGGGDMRNVVENDGAFSPKPPDEVKLECGYQKLSGGRRAVLNYAELGSLVGTWNTDRYYEVNRAGMTAVVKKQWAEFGGVMVFSWHMDNPYCTNGFKNGSFRFKGSGENSNVVRQILDGTGDSCGTGGYASKTKRPFANPKEWYKARLKDVADIFNGFVDEKTGKKIPVILRYPHEMDGSWFWWGRGWCSTEEYRKFCRATAGYLRKKCPGQILFAYTPDRTWNDFGSEGDTNNTFLAYYPGDKYVDIIGIDDYSIGHGDDEKAKGAFAETVRKLRLMSAFAKPRGQVVCISEAGGQKKRKDFWTYLHNAATAEGVRCAFVNTWHGSWGTIPETPEEAEDQKAFVAKPAVLMEGK